MNRFFFVTSGGKTFETFTSYLPSVIVEKTSILWDKKGFLKFFFYYLFVFTFFLSREW